MRKSKGRKPTKMVKMENENNLQVTFSKRKTGVFKKGSELCTLCDAQIAVILFSPGGKVYCFGHPDVETIINRFENNPPLNPQPNMQLDVINRNYQIRNLNNSVTEAMDQLESEQKTSADYKKLRKNSKLPENWLKESIGGLNLGQAKEYKGILENLMKQVGNQALNIFLPRSLPHPGYNGGSSSNAPFGVDGGININPNFNPFDQRRMVNMNDFYNHNIAHPNHPNPNESRDEHPYDGHPPQPRFD